MSSVDAPHTATRPYRGRAAAMWGMVAARIIEAELGKLSLRALRSVSPADR
jgi:hypothetical protein